MENYDVLEMVGEGTYGVVFKCRDKRTNRTVAVKQFKNFQTNAYIRVTMLRELRVEQLLKGEPNVTQLLETFKQKNRLYLVMEYIPRSLLDVLEEVRHGLREDALVVLLFTILLGIRSCHRNGIIHRDVKPENILVRDDGTASLCDFGFCRPLPQQLPSSPTSAPLPSSSMDGGATAPAMDGGSGISIGEGPLPLSSGKSKVYSGASTSSANSAMLSELVLADHQAIMTNYVATRWYRSPEMLLGMPSYTYAVDMWAVGAIMAEAVDGEPLLPGKTELEQLSLIQTRVGNFPAAYEAAVRKRNGGVLRLRSLNPLATSSSPQRTKSTSLRPRRASDATEDEEDAATRGTSGYLADRYGGLIAADGMNLLHRLLRVDAAERITVEEALAHPYFDDIRHQYDAALHAPAQTPCLDGDGDSVDTDEATDARMATEDGAEVSHSANTAAVLRQEPLPRLLHTGTVDYTATSLSTSCVAAGDGSSPFLVAAAPPLVGVPPSLTERHHAGTDDRGGAPLPMHRGADGSPRVPGDGEEAAKAPPSNSRPPPSPTNGDASSASSAKSASLSLWTASSSSADSVSAEAQAASSGPHIALPQLPGVLAPPAPPASAKGGVASGAGAAAGVGGVGSGLVGDTDSPPPRSLPEDNGGSADDADVDGPVLPRQSASEGANTQPLPRETSTLSENGNSAALLRSHRGGHSPRVVPPLRQRATRLGSGATATARTRADSPPMNLSAQTIDRDADGGADGRGGAQDFSASLSVLSSRRSAKNGGAGAEEARRMARRGTGANASHTKSPSSLLAQSYSFKTTPMHHSLPVARSLANTVVQTGVSSSSSSSDAVVGAAPEECAGEVKHVSGALSVPRSQGSRAGESASATAGAASAERHHTHRGSPVLSSVLPSARGAVSATRQRKASAGRRRDASATRAIPAAPSSVHEVPLASSLRGAAPAAAMAAALAEMTASKRRSTANSQRPPQPRRRTSTPPGGGGGGVESAAQSPALPTPLPVRNSPEASTGLSASDQRGAGRPLLSRFVSPKLPREVRPLPVRERMSLLKEIESLGFSVGTPSAVEVLGQTTELPASRRHGPRGGATGAGGAGHGPHRVPVRVTHYARADGVATAASAGGKMTTTPRDSEQCSNGDSRTPTASVEPRTQPSEPGGSRSAVAANARRGTAAPASVSGLADPTTTTTTTTSVPAGADDDAHQCGLNQRPPQSGSTSSGRPPRMELSCIAAAGGSGGGGGGGGGSSVSAAAASGVGSRTAPSLIFRSFRAASSPLKLAAIHSTSTANHGDSASGDLLNDGRHQSPSTSTATSFGTPGVSVAAGAPPAPHVGRLAPSLLRHGHYPGSVTTTTATAAAAGAAGAHSMHTPVSLDRDSVSGSVGTQSAAHSPRLTGFSPRSPRLSPRSRQTSLSGGGGGDARRSSLEAAIVSHLGARQYRLSDNPIELSTSEELLADAAAAGTRAGQRGHDRPTPLSTTPPTATLDDIETVLLTETPPAHRRTEQHRPHPLPSSSSWSPTRSGTTAIMANSMLGGSIPPRYPEREGDSQPTYLDDDWSGAPAAGSTRGHHSPEPLPTAPTRVLACDEDDVMNVSTAVSVPRQSTADVHSPAAGVSKTARDKSGPSLAPPPPLLGGASVMSAQQLHAGVGRKKSRLVL
ncbi:Mitogen-activated protein kinase 8 [Novymonas esmeraldas]|uniref:cyclin-dependent kinase n=1 Tax=Novymonas esmeraldas TaxID=1808958 RepID=A0AAW0F488_9TRYP